MGKVKGCSSRSTLHLGPILGTGGLAEMIPPTGLGVLLATLANVSVGQLLIAIIMPGQLTAFLYGSYIIVRCRMQPHLAPTYEVAPTPLLEKLEYTAKYVMPLWGIVFLVIGAILLGIATPTESAALGAGVVLSWSPPTDA